jgi:phosphatidylserine/phosphatidylglycerophosphate/cardiolipin synthase-like enzyme
MEMKFYYNSEQYYNGVLKYLKSNPDQEFVLISTFGFWCGMSDCNTYPFVPTYQVLNQLNKTKGCTTKVMIGISEENKHVIYNRIELATKEFPNIEFKYKWHNHAKYILFSDNMLFLGSFNFVDSDAREVGMSIDINDSDMLTFIAEHS